MPQGEPNPKLERVRFELRADGVPIEQPNPLRSGIHSRGYLPHVKREGASYFVTFRLGDSLPRQVLLEYLAERAARLRVLEANKTDVFTPLSSEQRSDSIERIEQDYRRKVERYLDKGVGACHLRRPEIAAMVADALRHFDGRQYFLDDWVIMPNHVHLILWPTPQFTLSEILKGRKQFTATQANLILGKTGTAFWQPESFDRWIREDAEKSRIRKYIRLNPVNAGLCSAPEDWRWSSAGRDKPMP